jgi:hypothetical protein
MSINEEETKLSIQRRDEEKKVDDSDLDPMDLKEFEEKIQAGNASKKEEEKDEDDEKEKDDEENKKPVSESDRPVKEKEDEKEKEKEKEEEAAEASPSTEDKEEVTSTEKVTAEEELKSTANESTTVFDEEELPSTTTQRPTIRKTFFKSIVLLHLRPENITEEESKAIVYNGRDRINSSFLQKLLSSALDQRNETNNKRLYSLDLLIDKTQQHWFDLLRDFFL